MKRISLGTVTAILVAAGTAAIAQPAPTAPTETITVVAPYLVTPQEVPAGNSQVKSSPHVKMMEVSVLGSASFADLDLSKTADAAILKTRINDEAKSLCKAIESKYPSTVYVPVTNQDCVKTATDEAMVAADILITAYHHI
jgi:UrcA family protein